MANIYTSAEQLIGNTPLLELTHFEKELNLKAKVLAKLEYFNPAGSIKDRVAKAIIEDAEQTSGGIFIPDSAKEKSQKGEVIAVGQGKLNDKGEREPMDVKVGEIVLFAKYAGTDVKVEKQDLKIMSVSDVLGVIER